MGPAIWDSLAGILPEERTGGIWTILEIRPVQPRLSLKLRFHLQGGGTTAVSPGLSIDLGPHGGGPSIQNCLIPPEGSWN